MEVAGEVDVDVFHRDDLAVSAAGGSALDSEDGAERGLAQRERDLFAELRKGLREPTEVVVLPSPAGVGVIAVTRMSLPSSLSFTFSQRSKETFALYFP